MKKDQLIEFQANQITMLKKELNERFRNKNKAEEWFGANGQPKKKNKNDAKLERDELAREVFTLKKLTRNQGKALEKSENQAKKYDEVT